MNTDPWTPLLPNPAPPQPPASPIAAPPPAPTSSTDYRRVFSEYLELRRFCDDAAEPMPFERFVEKLDQEQALVLREGRFKSVRFDVFIGHDGTAAIKAIGIA